MLYTISEIRKIPFYWRPGLSENLCFPPAPSPPRPAPSPPPAAPPPSHENNNPLMKEREPSDATSCCFWNETNEGKEKQEVALVRRTLFFLSRGSGRWEGLKFGFKKNKKRTAVMKQKLVRDVSVLSQSERDRESERERSVPSSRPENAG